MGCETESFSFRAPYFWGYIEFSVPQEFSASKRVLRSTRGTVLQMLVQSSVPLRFEFDLGPDGLELMKTLAKNKDEDKDWRDIKPHAAVLSGHLLVEGSTHAGEVRSKNFN